MEGQYKYGCSKSILDEWISGYYPIQELSVPAKSSKGVNSTKLSSAEQYKLDASGVASAGDGIFFDAKYSKRFLNYKWTDVVKGYESYGPGLLDLQVNGASVDWGAFNWWHKYSYTMPGTDSPATFRINDIYYPNNYGSLNVQISVKLY